MDQLAVMLGQAGHALLLDCRSGSFDAVPLPVQESGQVLLIIDTRVQHELSDGGYAARRRSCEAAADALGVLALRDVTDPSVLCGLDDPVMRRRARHVVAENQRVLEVAELLRAGRLAAIGPALNASHASLRNDFEVSWPEADAAADVALAAGAYGARMTGGGFGGSVISLSPAGSASAVGAAITHHFAQRGWLAPVIRSVVPSKGARRVR